MLDKDDINEYSDVELCGNSTYDNDSIWKVIDDRMILIVVVKLHNAWK